MEGEGGQERGTRAVSFTRGETQWGSAGGPVRPSILFAEGEGGQESHGLAGLAVEVGLAQAKSRRRQSGGEGLSFTTVNQST